MASRHSPRWATLIPNSTCSRASDLASASSGVAVSPATTRARANGANEQVREVVIRQIEATIAHRARHVPRVFPGKRANFLRFYLNDLRNVVGRVHGRRFRVAIIDVGEAVRRATSE